jgi:hypothetical protein
MQESRSLLRRTAEQAGKWLLALQGRAGNEHGAALGHATRGSACGATDEIRVGDQPQDASSVGLDVPSTLLAIAAEMIE